MIGTLNKSKVSTFKKQIVHDLTEFISLVTLFIGFPSKCFHRLVGNVETQLVNNLQFLMTIKLGFIKASDKIPKFRFFAFLFLSLILQNYLIN